MIRGCGHLHWTQCLHLRVSSRAVPPLTLRKGVTAKKFKTWRYSCLNNGAVGRPVPPWISCICHVPLSCQSLCCEVNNNSNKKFNYSCLVSSTLRKVSRNDGVDYQWAVVYSYIWAFACIPLVFFMGLLLYLMYRRPFQTDPVMCRHIPAEKMMILDVINPRPRPF